MYVAGSFYSFFALFNACIGIANVKLGGYLQEELKLLGLYTPQQFVVVGLPDFSLNSKGIET